MINSKFWIRPSLFFSFLLTSTLMYPDLDLKAKEQTIRHVVCFKFKDSAESDRIRLVEKEFVALKDKIDGIISLEWGKNNSPEGLNKNFTHCFIVTFKDEQSRGRYLPHPDHQAFVSILKPILDDVFVIDFTP